MAINKQYPETESYFCEKQIHRQITWMRFEPTTTIALLEQISDHQTTSGQRQYESAAKTQDLSCLQPAGQLAMSKQCLIHICARVRTNYALYPLCKELHRLNKFFIGLALLSIILHHCSVFCRNMRLVQQHIGCLKCTMFMPDLHN